MISYEIVVCFIVLVVLLYLYGCDRIMSIFTTNVAMFIGGGPRQRKNKTKDVIKDIKKHPRSKSEAAVIAHLEHLTRKPFPTVVPAWLGYELDGYNADLGVALEFSGPLHTKWTPTYEPYEEYYKRIMRDELKVRKCAEHGVKLIVVDVSLPRAQWRNYVASRLYDFGLAPKPFEYVAPQTAVPYRNVQLETELGLAK